MSEPLGCCRCCLGFLFSSGLTLSAPATSSLTSGSPPIANSTTTADNATVNFTLEVDNKNKQMGVLHDPLLLSLSNGNRWGTSVTIPGFYQGHDKTADRAWTARAGWVPWGAAAREVAAKGPAVYRVGVVTEYRYKVLLWKSRRHAVSVGTDVEVDGEGRKKAEKGIRLSSSGAPLPKGARRSLAVAGLTAASLSVVGELLFYLHW